MAGMSCRDGRGREHVGLMMHYFSGNQKLCLSMSHQRACLRTAVDVSALPQAFTLPSLSLSFSDLKLYVMSSKLISLFSHLLKAGLVIL